MSCDRDDVRVTALAPVEQKGPSEDRMDSSRMMTSVRARQIVPRYVRGLMR